MTFNTPLGGKITVNNIKGGVATVSCSICSLDEELFPLGVWKILIYNLQKGVIPCGCSKSPKYSKTQLELLIARKCKDYRLDFEGWLACYENSRSKILLKSLDDTSKSFTPTASNFLNRTKPYRTNSTKHSILSDHLPDIYKAGFQTSYEFKRKEGDPHVIQYTCGTCSNDVFVKNNLCNGVFESLLGNLKKGVKSCRCSQSFRWTKGQREYQINTHVLANFWKFNGWVSEDFNSKSKISVSCDKGHDFLTTVERLLSGVGCRKCYTAERREEATVLGYYPSRKLEQDYLYVVAIEDYVKVGRSFNVPRRFKELRFKSGKEVNLTNIELLLTGTHEDVYNAEQYLHKVLDDKCLRRYDLSWSIELFDRNSISICQKITDTFNLNPAQ
ncbi:hypothetical protein VPBG_00096 [Vibrio phage helene 12B3]|uniref:hypothetical protein n=1 Tax=Vibrio phage helene 12B3 TaxID=573173 RepID=UPI0002C1569E|nr:hypothetical protein VPBG_00096 [Vibrio phage helene 12B3]AGG57868.1 hypothetical protein VPBG_00096 [Vibrio phage helene 12B3]